MIVREVNDQVLKEMDTLVGEGVTSFKLFMAYPGVFMLDDAAIFQAMQRAADSGALIMMHAENGGPIDVLIRQYLATGEDRSGESRPHAPADHGGRGGQPRVQDGRAGGRARVHRPPVVARRARRGPRRAGSGRRGLRGDVPAVPVSLDRRHGSARLRGREVRVLASASHRRPSGRALEGAGGGRPPGRLHRPRAVQLPRTEGPGEGRLLQDPERPSLGRGPLHAAVPGRASTAGSASTASSRSSRPRPPGCSACIRGRARSPPGSTRTS